MKRLLLALGFLTLLCGSAFAQKTTPDAINGCVYNPSPSLATGQAGVHQCDEQGNQRVANPDAYAPQNNSVLSNQITGQCQSSCINTALFTVDTTGYNSISIQVTTAGTGTTITYQSSDDSVCSTATNWVNTYGINSINTQQNQPVQTSAATGIFRFPTNEHCFRAYITAYSSGAPQVEAYLRQEPFPGYVWGNVNIGTTDPCAAPTVTKNSAAINVTSATTTSLVAISGSTTIYVCGFSMTIAPSATSADTAQFEYGTGGTCGSGTTALTGTYGNGDLTSTTSVVAVNQNGPGTIFKTPASNGLCLLTAGTAVSVQGVVSYVQQ